MLGVALLMILAILVILPVVVLKEGLEEAVAWLATHWTITTIVFLAVVALVFFVIAMLSREDDKRENRRRFLTIPAHCIAFSGIPIFTKYYLLPVVINANYDIGFGDLFNFLIWCFVLFFAYLGYLFLSFSGNERRNIVIEYILAVVCAGLVILITIWARYVDRVA